MNSTTPPSLVTPNPATDPPLHPDSNSADWSSTRLRGGDELAWWAWLLTELGVATVIVVGDVSLLMLFFTRKLLGQSTNILVFSVAVADLITGLLVLPLDVLQRLLGETSGYMCKSYFYFSNVSKTAVIYTVTMLAMERIVAALSTTFRILSPGRCLFFSSLTWFFAAAYNIWSVVLYDTQHVQFARVLHEAGESAGVVDWSVIEGVGPNYSAHVCFSSTRFQQLVDVFVVLDFVVTFLAPVLASTILFAVFWKERQQVRAPGRPYRSSTSVIVFTFALLVSFVTCHVPLEVVALAVDKHDVDGSNGGDFRKYKACQLVSFTRGFWDLFIFGVFRHYVCRKERALASFRVHRPTPLVAREPRAEEPVLSPRTSLAVPTTGPPPSISLLDSDQEVTPHPPSSE